MRSPCFNGCPSLYLSPQPAYLPFHASPSSPPQLRLLKISCCLSVKETRNEPKISGNSNANDAVDGIRVVLAAGGTGGHIYPAVAIADELKLALPTSKFLFIGCPNSMESAAIPSAGYDFSPLPAVRLARPLASPQNLLLPYYLIKSLIKSFKVLQQFDPHVVIGTGGYVSFPICLAAALKGIKLVIQEQNSVPGIANWVLSFLAEIVFVAFNSSVECFPIKGKCIVSGNPVRLSLRGCASKAVAKSHFFTELPKRGKSEEGKLLLVLGGSLGANAVNIALLNLYNQMLLEHKNWYIIWQTGVEAFDEMESLVRNHPQLLLTPFLHSMELAYAAADLIISRAGAMTCYEILATGKPSILIPSPNVAEGHQFKNASLMADVAGSRVITEDELDSTTLGIAIEEILGDETLMADMSERALKAAKPDASEEIAKHILSLVNLPANER